MAIGAILLVVTGAGSMLLVLYAPDRCARVVVLAARLIGFMVNAAMGWFSLSIAFIGLHGFTDTSQRYNAGLAVSGLLISVAVIFNCVALVVSDQRFRRGIFIPAILISFLFFLVAIGPLVESGALMERPGKIVSVTSFYIVAFFSANAFCMRLAHRSRFLLRD